MNKMIKDNNAIEKVKADDVITSSVDELEESIRGLQVRVESLERLIMCIVDKLELDYPGITI